MNSYIITIRDNDVSESAAMVCEASHERVKNDFKIETFDAIIPDQVDNILTEKNIKWTYPWEHYTHDFNTGLKLSAYPTKDKKKRIACFLSHYLLWEKCVELNEPIIVLEHDAEWLRKFDPTEVLESKYNIVGLNSPVRATRRADVFNTQIEFRTDSIQPVPTVDDITIPQGLAGNSAYLIKPAGAKALIDKVHEVGAWPNDAIMCRQLIQKLGVTKIYYTKVQGTPSTTTI